MSTTRRVDLALLSTCCLVAGLMGAACSGDQDGSSSRPRYGGVGGDTTVRDPGDDGRRCPAGAADWTASASEGTSSGFAGRWTTPEARRRIGRAIALYERTRTRSA